MTHDLWAINETNLEQYFGSGEDLLVQSLPSIQFQPFFDLCQPVQQQHAIHQFPLEEDFVFFPLQHIAPKMEIFLDGSRKF